jgi:hypothetical protein
MFASKTPADRAIQQLEQLARDYAAPMSIINSARREIEAEIGKHAEIVYGQLDQESAKPGTLADARRAIITIRLKTRELAGLLIEGMAAAETEITQLHAENTERVQGRIREGVEPFVGRMLAAQMSRIAPAAMEEQAFQAKNLPSTWARQATSAFERVRDFDDRNLAADLVRQYIGAMRTLEVVREHSGQVKNARTVDVAA